MWVWKNKKVRPRSLRGYIKKNAATAFRRHRASVVRPASRGHTATRPPWRHRRLDAHLLGRTATVAALSVGCGPRMAASLLGSTAAISTSSAYSAVWPHGRCHGQSQCRQPHQSGLIKGNCSSVNLVVVLLCICVVLKI